MFCCVWIGYALPKESLRISSAQFSDFNFFSLRKSSPKSGDGEKLGRSQIMASDLPCCGTTFFFYVVIIIALVAFAGLMAGLTLGLMSLGLVDLEVLIKSGRPQDRINAGECVVASGLSRELKFASWSIDLLLNSEYWCSKSCFSSPCLNLCEWQFRL